MTVGTGVLVKVQQDTETAAGDVVEVSTVDKDVAVVAFKGGGKAALCLTAGNVVEVADDGDDQSAILFF